MDSIEELHSVSVETEQFSRIVENQGNKGNGLINLPNLSDARVQELSKIPGPL